MSEGQIILALAPLLAVSLALTLFSIRDLVLRPSTAVLGGNKWVWLAVILLVSTFGPILYLLFGRTEPPVQEE